MLFLQSHYIVVLALCYSGAQIQISLFHAFANENMYQHDSANLKAGM